MDERPLSEVVLCCTGVPNNDRLDIFKKAQEMGATCLGDLTTDVTHLVVNDPDSEKYRYAARHRSDMVFMRADWIAAMHGRWLEGHDDLSLADFERRFALPVFFCARVCVTNLDPRAREEVWKLVEEHGGAYTGDMTRENTHLICGEARGAKYEAAVAWNCGIRIVRQSWLYASTQRGAMLDTACFSFARTAEEAGKGAYVGNTVHPRLRRAQEDSLADVTSISAAGDKRKRGSTAGNDLARKRLSKRLSGVHGQALWGDILENDHNDTSVTVNEEISFDVPSVNLDLTRTSVHVGDARDASLSLLGDLAPNLRPGATSSGIFAGQTFYSDGFDDRQRDILRKTIEDLGGELLDQDPGSCTLIVPQAQPEPSPKRLDDGVCVTEFWIERCLVLGRLEPPESHFTSTPFEHRLPIDKMASVAICMSGITGVDQMHVERVVKLCGARFSENLDRSCSIMLTTSRTCRKFQAACDRGVRVLRVEWLWACIREGRMVGITEHALDGVAGSRCRIDGQQVLVARAQQALQGVVCYIAPSVAPTLRKNVLDLAGRLGVAVRDTLTKDVTHVLGEVAEDQLLATGDKFHVKPIWLEHCSKRGKKLDAAAYPTSAAGDGAPARDPLSQSTGKLNGATAVPLESLSPKSAAAVTSSTVAVAAAPVPITRRRPPRLDRESSAGGRSSGTRRLIGKAKSQSQSATPTSDRPSSATVLGDPAAKQPVAGPGAHEPSIVLGREESSHEQPLDPDYDLGNLTGFGSGSGDGGGGFGRGINPSQAVVYRESENKASRLAVLQKLGVGCANDDDSQQVDGGEANGAGDSARTSSRTRMGTGTSLTKAAGLDSRKTRSRATAAA